MPQPGDERPANKSYIDLHGYYAYSKCTRCIASPCDCVFLLRSDIRNQRKGLKKLFKCSKCTKDSKKCIVEGIEVNADKRTEFGDRHRKYITGRSVGGGGVEVGNRQMNRQRTGHPIPAVSMSTHTPQAIQLRRLEIAYKELGTILKDLKSTINRPSQDSRRVRTIRSVDVKVAKVEVDKSEGLDELDELESISED